MSYRPSYWNSRGKYQQMYDDLYKALIPEEGKSKTPYGELLRVVSNIYYDIYNNGYCNMDSYYEERVWLVGNVPSSMKYVAMEFQSWKSKHGPGAKIKELSQKRMKFLDKFVDWTVVYVSSQCLVAVEQKKAVSSYEKL